MADLTADQIAHEVAERHNNTGGEFEGWLRLYVDAIRRGGFQIVRQGGDHVGPD